MKTIRRLIVFLSSVIAIWTLASFAGAMFDASNASFWTASLMWALLSALLVMPALVIINHASKQAARQNTRSPRASAQNVSAENTSTSDQTRFVDESDRRRTLWPEPEEEKKEWPQTGSLAQ